MRLTRAETEALLHLTGKGTKGLFVPPEVDGIYYDHKAGVAVATNTQILGFIEGPDEPDSSPVFAPRSALARVVKAYRKDDTLPDEGQSLGVPVTDGFDYPVSWRSVFSNRPKADVELTLSVVVLEKLVKAAKAIGEDTIDLKILNDVHTIDFQAGQLKGIFKACV